jgi:toxin-antitoxin system PIN domain toxin
MAGAPEHARARAWLDEQLSATHAVALPWIALLGFVRISGQARMWDSPLGVTEALRVVRSWLSQPNTWVPEPGPRHFDVLAVLLEPHGSSRLTTDAHLAALAIEHGLELCSRDRDFARWTDDGLRSRDPLA